MNLENYGVKELKAKEINETNGGLWQFVAGAIIGGLIWDGVKWVYTHDVEGYGEWLLETGSPGGAK
ncbi:hypothetical protein [Mesonia sp. HuA40]|uniref:hypothetical protein n=1 Tax=Mesonia sp. HuA40 TaxID=2602761 RepID=UPI0011C903A0|nr:hypothetical protein [Mesonia sp. HuA40]TXK73898.1 hypothetical protein FT993_03300 [Mesonia sp. HuA40]